MLQIRGQSILLDNIQMDIHIVESSSKAVLVFAFVAVILLVLHGLN